MWTHREHRQVQEKLTPFPPYSPFTGNVSIRGRILSGKVIKTKMNRTIIIRREYLHFVQKYSRYEKRCAWPELERERK